MSPQMAANLASMSNMARLRGELVMRSRTSKHPIQFYGELRYAASTLTDGDTFSFSLTGTVDA